jgi:hypothetical protein
MVGCLTRFLGRRHAGKETGLRTISTSATTTAFSNLKAGLEDRPAALSGLSGPLGERFIA